MFREALQKLTAREHLDLSESERVMKEIISGNLSDAQIGAFLGALMTKGEDAAEMAGFARALGSAAVRVPLSREALDTCGTGGSGLDTPNTSTMAAFVVAADGVTVAKHGNRASSGKCGSSDLLEALGLSIELGPSTVQHTIEQCGIGFMFAPRFHPALRHVASTRRALGVRTTFNFLGPLVNPAKTTLQLLGVSDPRRAPLMLEALVTLGSRRVLIVCGADGLDEITLSTTTEMWLHADGQTHHFHFDPDTHGVPRHAPEAMKGGGPDQNVSLFRGVIDGIQTGAVRDLVAINAGAALFVAERVESISEGYLRAVEIIKSGAMRAKFEDYRSALENRGALED